MRPPSADCPMHVPAVRFRHLYAGDLAAQALGIEILDVAPGRVRLAMTVRPDMLNGHGICHGGIIFALADTAFAFACNSHGDAMVAAGASIEFLAPGSAANGSSPLRARPRAARATESTTWPSPRSSGEPLAHFRGRCARLRVPSTTP